MPKELIGLVVNPKKRKRSSGKRGSSKKTRRRRRRFGNLVIITNPSKDVNALLEMSLGAAAGLAGGKLLDRALFNQFAIPLPMGISAGDLTMLGVGAFLLKDGGRKKEFATGVVAGAGAKLLLNVIDKTLFKGRNVIALHGEDYVEPYPEVDPIEEEPFELEGEPVVEELPEEPVEEITEPEYTL
jgi:hypothetical protein